MNITYKKQMPKSSKESVAIARILTAISETDLSDRSLLRKVRDITKWGLKAQK